MLLFRFHTATESTIERDTSWTASHVFVPELVWHVPEFWPPVSPSMHREAFQPPYCEDIFAESAGNAIGGGGGVEGGGGGANGLGVAGGGAPGGDGSEGGASTTLASERTSVRVPLLWMSAEGATHSRELEPTLVTCR